jgi:hypothetical protein
LAIRKSLSTLFSLFEAKLTALSNKVLFSFISAGVLTAKLHQESISFGLQNKRKERSFIS